MGIPGLGRELQPYMRWRDREYFKGCDIYVDALNFANIPIPYVMESYDDELKVAEKVISQLRSLEPNSITFVIDAMISREKLDVKIERSKRNATSKYRRTSITSALFAVVAKHRDIVWIYSGAEGEDEILKLIDEDKENTWGRRLVFTNDHDVYRFNFDLANKVEIVPERSLRAFIFHNKPNIGTINIRRILNSRIEIEHIYPPIERPGRSFEMNPPKKCRNYCELINCGLIYNRLFASYAHTEHGAAVSETFEPTKAGLLFRRVFYGIIIRNYFQHVPGFCHEYVEEWNFKGVEMVPSKVRPLEDDKIDSVLSILYQSSLQSIVTHQIKLVAEKNQITSSEMDGITEYISNLTDKLLAQGTATIFSKDSDGVSLRSYELIALIRATLQSLTLLEQSLEKPFEHKGMSYSLVYHNLSATDLQLTLASRKKNFKEFA